VTRALREANMLGSEVLWFAREWWAVSTPSSSNFSVPVNSGFLEARHR
jgi:hypothetical protein